MLQKIKQNRAASFFILALVYALAAVVGIWVYLAVALSWWLSLLLADVAATAVTFLFSLIFGNASVYDPYWSVQPLVILASFAVGREITLFGALLLGVVFLWGLRLTANWAYTFGGLLYQDWRYTMLHEKTGAFYPIINFVGIHLVPTLVVWGCTLPAVYAILNGVRLTVGGALCLLVSLLAVVLQGGADIQMHQFRKNRTATFIRIGFWKHSRHPNYLGEILMWWGVALAVICGAGSVWFLAAGALSNTLLFFAVSIPLADGKQSKKEGYSEYKKQTRMLLPIPKRKRGAA